MSKFKIGDRVRIVRACHDGAVVGHEVTIQGVDVHDRGVRWNYLLSDGKYCLGSSNSLELLLRDLDHLRVGDVLVDKYDTNTVLGVVGQAILLANGNGSGKGVYTVKELKTEGWRLTQPVPADDTLELTLEDVAKLKGVSVDKIRIKEAE